MSRFSSAQLSRAPIGTRSSMSEKAPIRTRDPTPAASVSPAYPVAVSDSPLELCRRYRDAFFARDVEAILALVTPDFVFENVTAGERVEGIDAVRRHIADIHSRWPDLRS